MYIPFLKRILRLSVFGQFTLLGIIVFFILGLFLSTLVAPVLAEFIVRQQELNAVVFANRTATEHLLPEDFSAPARGESRVRFEEFVRNLQVPGLFRIKIWNPEGIIVYSDKEELIGKQFPLSEGVRQALNLEAKAELVTFDPDDPYHIYEAPFKEALEVYAPVTFGASLEVVGIIETYARIGFLNQQINELKNLFALRIVLSLVLMFAVLSFIVWRASRTVDRQRTELRKYATGLEHMVDERTHELKETSKREIEKARELVRLRDQFVFIAAHELRTPATAIKWGLEDLQLRQPDFVKQQKTFFDVLQESSERLVTLVQDLLEVARIEGKTIKIELKNISIVHALSDVLKELQETTKEQGIVIHSEIREDFPRVLGNSTRLKEVFVNLLSNAIKYNKKGGGSVDFC